MKPVLVPASHLTRCFSAGYAEAYEKFKKLVNERGDHSRTMEFVYRETGPAQEKLFTSVYWHGEPDAKRVLVIQSATHGVEGFAGSAIQLDLLKRLDDEPLPSDTAILFIHAINPYGFAWLRRVNEQGIDLNRNFVDFAKPLPVNEDYRQLAQAILPTKESDWKVATKQLHAFRDSHGQQAYELAVSGGQYEFPEGLFYGGTEPSQSRLNMEQIINDFNMVGRERVAVVDIHTGLGPFGYGELICDHPLESQGLEWAKQWFGNSVTEPALGSSTSVPKHGLIDYLWHEKLGESVCFVTLEFGTWPVENMFEVLRRDHMLHRKEVDWSSIETKQIKQAIRNNFYPDSADWQEMILLRGRQVIGQAIMGLNRQD